MYRLHCFKTLGYILKGKIALITQQVLDILFALTVCGDSALLIPPVLRPKYSHIEGSEKKEKNLEKFLFFYHEVDYSDGLFQLGIRIS